MRIVIISDTHEKHSELGNLTGDVLIHCGDFCRGFGNDGSILHDVDEWYLEQQFEKIYCIGGNHDFEAQRLHESDQVVFQNAEYLVDQLVEFRGVRFYGMPWIPDLEGWAYYLSDSKRQKKCRKVPNDVDVLITHTPPYGVLDKPRSGRNIGCPYLQEVVPRISPKVHCFGHVHASPGQATEGNITYINATVVDSSYEIAYEPTIVEI